MKSREVDQVSLLYMRGIGGWCQVGYAAAWVTSLRPPPPSPPRWRHWLLPVALIAFLALWLLLPTLHTNQVTLSYSQFLS